MPIDMFPRTIENRLKMERYVSILRHQSARIEPCGECLLTFQGMTDIRKVTETFSLENMDLSEFKEKGHSRTVDFTDLGCPFCGYGSVPAADLIGISPLRRLNIR